MAKRKTHRGKHDGIFTAVDLAALKKAETDLHATLAMMDDAEACGVECQAMREVIASLQGQLSEIEKRFMTPAPVG